MLRDDLHITVPTYFRCPISLDVMKSPVSLCTGVTYDRSSIQRWLDSGNNTCPATMQLLRTTELIPNHTLQRLINIWSHTLPPQSQSQSLSLDQASHIVSLLHSHLQNHSLHYSSFISQSLSALTPFAAESDDNARFLAARILPSLLPLTAKVRDFSFLEKLLLFCNVLLKKNLAKSDSDALRSRIDVDNLDFKSTVLIGLKQGRLELRIAVAKFVELLARNTCVEINSCSISEDDEFHLELLKLMSSSDAEAVDASLSLLTRLAQLKRNRARIVRDGGVAALAAALAGAEMNVASTEKVLKLVEMATGSKEGRNEICGDDGNCVRAVVKKVLKVSGAATEHAVTVLWSLCCLYGDKRAAAAVVESNGMAKILVVLQSDCSPPVRRMCADLLRVFRCSSKTSCVSWYDTKTTHIMPF